MHAVPKKRGRKPRLVDPWSSQSAAKNHLTEVWGPEVYAFAVEAYEQRLQANVAYVARTLVSDLIQKLRSLAKSRRDIASLAKELSDLGTTFDRTVEQPAAHAAIDAVARFDAASTALNAVAVGPRADISPSILSQFLERRWFHLYLGVLSRTVSRLSNQIASSALQSQVAAKLPCLAVLRAECLTGAFSPRL